MYTSIIAARIGDPLLVDALKTIAEQTRPPARILVVCNPEEPMPDAWVATARRSAERVEVVRAERHGMVAALNHGIGLSATEYVAFLDTDDLWLPEKQERQIAALESSPALDAVSCRAANVTVDADGTRVGGAPTPAIMFTCTTFRRRTFEAFGLLDPATTHFTWLYRWWGQAHARGITTEGLDYVGLHRRLHPGNSWSEQRRTAHQDLLREVRAHVRRRRA